ncbi:hypothetical protein TNCV_1411551 [Trichonephila clavipes]|nr:hypothetical protein TNCV_1411551 [Trichonephila clavipes]
MVLEDTGAPSEGATGAWMAANEAVGCTRAFLRMLWFSRRLVCRGCSEPCKLHISDPLVAKPPPNTIGAS